MSTEPSLPDPASTEPSRATGYVKVRRSRGVRFLPWLVTGGFLGLVAGLFLGVGGDMHPRYTENTQVAYLAVLGAVLGALAAGGVAALLDAVLLRRR